MARLLWNHVRMDLARHRRQPLEFLIWLGIPLMIGFLFTLLFGGGGGEGPQPVAHVLVVDEDSTFVSGLLLRALDEESTRGFVKGEVVTAEDGRRRIDDGEATALLTIPAGFSDAILLEEPLALPLATNPAQRILPMMVEEGLQVLVDGHFYLHRLIGEDLRRFAAMDSMPSDAEIAAFSVKMSKLFERLGESFDPLLLEVVDEPPPPEALEAEEESPSTAFLFLPSVLFMALLFMASGLAGEIWEEEREGTLKRVLVTPGGAPPFLLGKLVAAMILFLAVGALSLAAGSAYLDLPLGQLPVALLWIALSGGALAAGFTALQLLFPTQRAANVVSLALIFPLMMLGGSFFPFEAMPGWMAALGAKTPNGWALQHLKAILLGREGAEALLGGLGALLAAIVLLTLFNAWRLRARFAGR